MEVDVVIVGSGAAGLTAAVVAAHAGMKVVVLESTPLFGGTTAFSGGGVWVSANHHLVNSGIEDNFDAGEAYLKAVLSNFYDRDFGRGGNAYSANMGDFTHKPNTALGELRTPAYYALEIRPSALGSVVGLETSGRAEVLDQSGTPIPGLYAAGLDANTIMRGRYPGGGSSLGPAMTFGYIAAKELAREAVA